MNILIDLGYVYDETSLYVGVVKYALRILDSIVEAQDTGNYTLIVNNSIKHYFDEKYPDFRKIIIQLSDYRKTKLYWIRQIKKLFSTINDYQQYKKIKMEYDFVFCPFSNYAGLTLNHLKNQIITMHDFYHLDKWKKKSIRYIVTYNQTRKRMKNAKKIITISNYTKNELKKRFPRINTEIRVIPNIILKNNILGEKIYHNEKPYFLWINAILPHKNILTMLEAFWEGSFYKDYNLVIVGKKNDYWNTVIIPYIKNKGIEKQIYLYENVSESILQGLYENAFLFITTSLKEGFGLTPVEAAINTVPVISTKSQALPEATMNLVNYYEPALSSKELEKEIQNVILNYPEIKELEEIREKILTEYSPTRIYNLLKDLFYD